MVQKPAILTTNNIPSHDASAMQRTASDPNISSWVSASAGSGKTKVLTDRMLRLLLPREDGRPATPPEKILALTFTKAGASEMSSRLSKRLSEWAVMSDEKLRTDMKEALLGRAPTPEEMTVARQLFAHVVDAPGGLKIMTIHSFCQSVLGRFPLEAGLTPGFTALGEQDSADLMTRARRTVLENTQTHTGSPMAAALNNIAGLMNEDQLSGFLSKLSGERHQFEQLLARHFGLDGLYAAICTQLGLPPHETEGDTWQTFLNERTNEQDIRRLCARLAMSKSKTDIKKADTFQTYWDSTPPVRAEVYQAYRDIFFNSKGELAPKVTKEISDDIPECEAILLQEGERIARFEEKRKALNCAILTHDAFRFGKAVLDVYDTLKANLGALDYDDMILKTLSLLEGNSAPLAGLGQAAPWVLYKLDEGIDHILVDEAQDTNPEQWDIIRHLSIEFFVGKAARNDAVRTLFVVGDGKQSIFSFQRAAPDKFRDMEKFFEEKIQSSGQIFTPVGISTSFRSVQIVLDAVDTVFNRYGQASFAPSSYRPHIAFRADQGGVVEIWPLFQTVTDTKKEEGWILPDKIVEEPSGSSKLADKIGDTIQKWIASKELLASYNRPIEARDIMILVRSRNAFVGQLVRALKTRGVPVSGVDRMVLGDELVVQDMAACASFALLPDDDLTLACLLKSPFIGYDEDKLFTLAHAREKSLWHSLKLSGDTAIINWLEDLIGRAGSEHPYEFFTRLVQEPCPSDKISGLRAIRRRLGEDAMDPLEEFLTLAMEYEQNHIASLQSFLQWHGQGKSEIKRQMEEAGTAVRIMTVHGSKGLQAPIVFLPDTVRSASARKNERILWPDKSGLDVPLVSAGKAAAPAMLLAGQDHARDREDEEYRRLLYVAMTRAEERLYIAGYTGKKPPSENGRTPFWYDDIRAAIQENEGVLTIPSGETDESGQEKMILRLEAPATGKPDKAPKKEIRLKGAAQMTVPPYFYEPAPEEAFPPQPLMPSRPSEPEPPAASPLRPDNMRRFKRGTVTHKLLQHLPSLPIERRKAAAEKFVAQVGFGLAPEVRESIVEETLKILNDPIFSALFGPASLPEAPVTGFLDGKTLISGQIDRLLITSSEILIVDYKTNRPPPETEAEIPSIYRRQMQAYADTIARIYPARTIRAALLWTDGPRLMEIALKP